MTSLPVWLSPSPNSHSGCSRSLAYMVVEDIYNAISHGQTLHPDMEDEEGMDFLFVVIVFSVVTTMTPISRI